MEEHRANPQCQSCHRVIDPIGLALENFDVVGMWRIRDGGTRHRRLGHAVRRHAARRPGGAARVLLKRKDVVLRTFTENLMAYGLGRRLEPYDMPTVRRVVRDAGAAQNHFSSFVIGDREEPGVSHEPGRREQRIDTCRGGSRAAHNRTDQGHRTCICRRNTSRVARFSGAWARPSRCRSSTRWSRRGRCWRRPPPPARRGWRASRRCTAPPAARRSAWRRTSGRRPRSDGRSISRRAACRRSSRSATT